MEGSRFDALAKAIARGRATRRGLLGFLGGSGLAVALGRSPIGGPIATVTEHAAAAPPQTPDLIAAAVQPTDPALGGTWAIVRSQWTAAAASLNGLDPALASVIGAAPGLAGGVAVTLASTASDSSVNGWAQTIELACESPTTAQGLWAAYVQKTAPDVAPLDAAALLGEASGARIATVAQPTIPERQMLPGTPAVEVTYAEGAVFGRVTVAGDDPARGAALGKGLIARLSTGKTPGDDLTSLLAFLPGGPPVVDVSYIQLDGKSQRLFDQTAAQFKAQKVTVGKATNFALAHQVIPTTEAGTTALLTTWGIRFPTPGVAQAWMDGTDQRLATQFPDAQLVSINEADGFGDASKGLLYTLTRADGVAIGVALYGRTGSTIRATGLSVSAPQMTNALSALFATPQLVGTGAQTVFKATWAPHPASSSFGLRSVPDDIFAGWPVAMAATGSQPAPTMTPTPGGQTTAATTFTACEPACNKPAKHDQTRPYQVWCQPATKCTDAKCTCNLFRTKKKTTTEEWFGNQNEMKEYDPDNYTYACKCGTAKTGQTTSDTSAQTATPLPDLAYAVPHPGRDVPADYQLGDSAYCFGLDVCRRIGALSDPYAGWIPAGADFLDYHRVLQRPAAKGGQTPQSVIDTSVLFFDTSAHAKQAEANWTKGFGGAQAIDTTAKGWHAFGFGGTQNGAKYDAVAGFSRMANHFVVVQQTDYGTTVDRPGFATMLTKLAGYLGAVRAGTAPNLGRLALDAFAGAPTAAAWVALYIVIDGFFAGSVGQTKAGFEYQQARNKGVEHAFLAVYYAATGATAATTVRTFKTAKDGTNFYGRETDPAHPDEAEAGITVLPFDKTVAPTGDLAAAPVLGVDKTGALVLSLYVNALAKGMVLTLELADGVVKVAKGGTVTPAFLDAIWAGMSRCYAAVAALLPGGNAKPAAKPAPLQPMALCPEWEALDNTCKTDPKQCVK